MKFWDILLFMFIFNLSLGVLSATDVFNVNIYSEDVGSNIEDTINSSNTSVEQSYGLGDILTSMNLVGALTSFVWIEGFLHNLGMPTALAYMLQAINSLVYLVFIIEVVRGFLIE